MKLDRYHYLFNAAAYFAAAEKFPENGIVAAIAGQGPEADRKSTRLNSSHIL